MKVGLINRNICKRVLYFSYCLRLSRWSLNARLMKTRWLATKELGRSRP